ANITSGCAPQVIKFTDLSTGSPTQWFWDLGNGTTSTQQNPTTFYFDPGTFTVKLVVKNAAGKDSLTKVNYISVFSSPQVDFNSTSTGVIDNYLWTFGNGISSAQQNPTATYTSRGSYTVKLVIKNNDGCSDSITKSNIININTVKADFTTSAPVCKGSPVTFI